MSSSLQLITKPSDRIGRTAIPIDPERVVAVVETNSPDNTGVNAPEVSKLILE
jgi:acetyl-CoA hydrolase